jgi:uncharacterized ferritin-like protein (DUF455 family)
MKGLKTKFHLELENIKNEFDKINWADPNKYAEFLAQTYFYARYTTRILALAGVRVPLEERKLHARLLTHAGEERGHDKMILNDLKALGRDIGEFESKPFTSACFQTQYYLIEHVNPMALYGFILLLEGVSLACGPELYEKVTANFKNATTYLKVHIEEDEDHVAQNLKAIETMNPHLLKAIHENLVQTSGFYIGMLRDVVATNALTRKILKAA